MSEKRGQFTIFIILGLVLVVAFAFIFYIRSFTHQTNLQNQADELVQEAVSGNQVNLYVKGCLNRVTDDALELLGVQGGVIYKSQGGLWPDPTELGRDYITFNTSQNSDYYTIVNVSYAILPNNNQTCVRQNPPNYPFTNLSIYNISDKYNKESVQTKHCELRSGAFGTYNLSYLCAINGSNRERVAEDLTNGNLAFQYRTCAFGDYGNYSIQEQLEAYIANKINECVDGFKVFTEKNYNISDVTKPNTTLTFGQKEFTVQTTYGFKVNLKGRAYTSYQTFSIQKPNYFKELLEHYIISLMAQEYKNVFFDIDKYYNKDNYLTSNDWRWNLTRLSGFDAQIRLYKYPNSCVNCTGGTCSDCDARAYYDDVVQIVDNRTDIRGKPFVINLPIKNRAPVLDYIDGGYKYNIVAMEGDIINITPFGKDPDEGLVVYNYTGWKESYNAKFNETCCVKNPSACASNPSFCVINLADKPLNWTRSQQFVNTKQNASIITKRKDLGLHHTIVAVKDEEGLVDFQNISIMVFDVPRVEASGSNDYNNQFPENISSIEDPYTLNAKSLSYFSTTLNFTWHDDIEPFLIETPGCYTLLPNKPFNIKNIVDGGMFFKKFNKTIDPSIPRNKPERLHNISLKAKYVDLQSGAIVYTVPSILRVNVYQCVPYKLSNEQGISAPVPPYPYNNYSKDQGFGPNNYANIELDNNFLSDHICCKTVTDDDGDGQDDYYLKAEYKPGTSGTDCYDFKGYSAWGSLGGMNLNRFNDPNEHKEFGDYPLKPTDYATDPTNNDWTKYDDWSDYSIMGHNLGTDFGINNFKDNPMINDIFVRSFTRYCSGDRGNVCSGLAKQTLQVAKICPDAGEDEFCVGPNPQYYKTENETDPNSLANACYNFEKTTFNKAYGHTITDTFGHTIQATGSCNYNEVCSSVYNGPNYGVGTLKLRFCNATCSGGACEYINSNTCDDCRRLDKRAIDSDDGFIFPGCNGANGDCPISPHGFCKEVAKGGCNAGGCFSSHESILYDACFKDSDTWEYKEYFISNKNGGGLIDNHIKESCVKKIYDDLDISSVACSSGCGLEWNNNWDTDHKCCGNDPDEYYKDDSTGPGCCDATTDCAYNYQCYSDGTTINNQKCDGGSWILVP